MYLLFHHAKTIRIVSHFTPTITDNGEVIQGKLFLWQNIQT